MKLLDKITLNGTWELRDEILSCDLAMARHLSYVQGGWIPTPVPGDIHEGLIAAGRIHEPLLGLNSFACRWTEQRSWWYRRTFQMSSESLHAEAVELELNGLDSNAEVFLNGYHIGSHCNAFRPFVCDVRRWLQAGENVLLVRLSAGVENVTEADTDAPDGIRASTEADRGRPERGDERRTLVRKPQYSFGWDWNPRVATTAIAGNATIRVMNEACIRHVSLRPIRQGREVLLTVLVTVDRFHYYRTGEARLRVVVSDQREKQFTAQKYLLLRSGYNYAELTLLLEEPQFWWPNGLGEPHLYRVAVDLQVGDESTSYPSFEYGLRFVELDTQDKFAIVINGRKVFCKGADWVPADAIYARVSDDRYEALVREAHDARFNMLRIWGGGLYERDAFYRACDRYGIMIWHDFMFACAPYPDHLDWFRHEVREEADYQVKRLQHHACVVLWSGCNENNWGFRDWWHEKTRAGAWTYNYALPRAVQDNSPEIPYWNGSPYGGDEPNSSEVGDRHHWGDCMMNPDMVKRITPEEYDKCTSLFVSEFGYVGACCKETVLTYMDGAPLERNGRVWQHHTNTFEKDTVEAGIRKHYVDPETLDLDRYLLYSGLCQGLMYAYALESMRYRAQCHGSLFWMYNDSWGEVGWTIIDYYLRRKPSWYFVRRAFAPLRLIMRPATHDGQPDRITVVMANDTVSALSFELEYGYVSLDGRITDMKRSWVEAAALERTELCTFDRGGHDPRSGLWIARAPGLRDVDAAIFRAVDFRQLRTTAPRLRVAESAGNTRGAAVQVSTDVYAHAVHLVLPSGVLASDDYFDLLPGESREIALTSTEPIDLGGISVSCANL